MCSFRKMFCSRKSGKFVECYLQRSPKTHYMVVHMRHTKGHTANRRSHHALKVARFITCPKCSEKHLMHRVCANCGNYRGRVVVDTLKKTLKAAKKAEARKDAGKPAEESPKKEAAPKAEKKTEKKTEKKSKK